MNRLQKLLEISKNMGARYVFFRSTHAFESKMGLFERKFPIHPEFKDLISLEDWRENAPPFFFDSRNDLKLKRDPRTELKTAHQEILSGRYTFFSHLKYDLGPDYDWVTNPDNGYRYDVNEHFSKIEDLSQEKGDIKYVWEKARFTFLYDIIQYDFHFDDDSSSFVFSEIENFISKNPINQGPNYKCSQEISLRILNWTFALYFYKYSKHLTEDRFKKMMNHIYWQLDHVYKNINFSRIAVRNNHAITETLMLYLSGKLFPFMDRTSEFSKKGKKWFQAEIEYQIYEDGTFLQYSMNYHRVVIQLLTWGIRLSEINEDRFDDIVYQRARNSLYFLDSFLNEQNGFLPNYGSNDGALFFNLSPSDYRDFRPQLDDLRAVLENRIAYNTMSHSWYGIEEVENIVLEKDSIQRFKNGGYYLINDQDSLTFIRCGSYKDRPAQADNLHLDVWVNGQNYLTDSGSYKYNTDPNVLRYFMGSEGHNTISVEGSDQMLKGSRFIWYHWIKKADGRLSQDENSFRFNGYFEGFKHVRKGIVHRRSVLKVKSKLEWEVVDEVANLDGESVSQYWHVNLKLKDKVEISTSDYLGNEIEPIIRQKWTSNYYGSREGSLVYEFKTKESKLKTTIRISE